jgi:ABC-type phosphate transport system substrate-binding protein
LALVSQVLQLLTIDKMAFKTQRYYRKTEQLSRWIRLFYLIGMLCVLTATVKAQRYNILAGGATFPATLYRSLALLLENETKNLTLSYTSLGSTGGKCRIVGNCASSSDVRIPQIVDFAGTDAIFSNSEYSLTPDIQLYPALAGAIVIIFNVLGVSNLVVTPAIISDIFRACKADKMCMDGWISRWDDPRIVALNQGKASLLTAAGDIKVIVRADGSGTTDVFKRSMAFYNANFSIQFAGEIGENANWPNASVLLGSGNEGLTERVKYTTSSIGYTTLGTAVEYQLPYVGIGASFLEADGILRASQETVERALFEKALNFGNNGDLPVTRLTSDGYGTYGSEAYPFSTLTYFAVRKIPPASSCAQRKATYLWFKWFYSSAKAAELITNSGFQPVGSSISTCDKEH